MSLLWPHLGAGVGLTVGLALPVSGWVSGWVRVGERAGRDRNAYRAEAASRLLTSLPACLLTCLPAPHVQIISMWANGVGALLTMLADRFK